MLVGQRDDGARDGLLRIRRRLPPTCGRVADTLARDLFEQQLRHVSAAVVANVDDQTVAIALGDEVAMKFGKAGGHHIGQM